MAKKRCKETRYIHRPGTLLILLFLISLGMSAGKVLIDRVVANVNGEPILESELKIASLFYGTEDRKKILDTLVERHLIAQYLKQQGFNVPEFYADEYLKELAKANGKTLEEFLRELYNQGVTPTDLKRFIELETLATLGFQNFLGNRIDVSEIEIEIERLKEGEVKYAKIIELLVVDKNRAQELLDIGDLNDLDSVSQKLNVPKEKMKVYKGDLIEPLDKEIWRADAGKVVVAEDENNIYLAKVIKIEKEYSGRSEEEIRKKIMLRKLEEAKAKLLQKLKDKSYIEILSSSNSAS